MSPTNKSQSWSAAVLLIAAATGVSFADADEGQEAIRFTSEHRITTGGEAVRYTATAGETLLRDEAGKPVAAVWSTAYVADGGTGERPVVFVFSGGPGAASGSMNVGFLGPKTVRHTEQPTGTDDGAAPFELVDNPDSLFDVSDFVFVDPVGTGFSRAVGAGRNTEFWSMAADTASMASFIHSWITENERWNSPKYILGLSYGTTRAVTIARKLSYPPHEMALNGLLLHGPALDFLGLDPLVGNPLSYVSFLPTMAAIAHYHGKAGGGQTLEEFVEEARQFARGDYFAALFRGSNLADAERQSLADRMSRLIGLDAEFILNAHFRVSVARFRAELLRDRGLVVGYSDGRYVGRAPDPNAAEPSETDPSTAVYSHAYAAAINRHLSADLGVAMNRPYQAWNARVGKDWTWSPDLSVFTKPQAFRQAKRSGRIEVAGQLASVMQENAALKVQVAVAYYDLYTPFFDSERVFANFGIDARRVEMSHYETGHRLWHNSASRQAIVADIRRFLTDATE
ncbi:MAG: peptidase S10 [Pseudomonadota bacterium]